MRMLMSGNTMRIWNKRVFIIWYINVFIKIHNLIVSKQNRNSFSVKYLYTCTTFISVFHSFNLDLRLFFLWGPYLMSPFRGFTELANYCNIMLIHLSQLISGIILCAVDALRGRNSTGLRERDDCKAGTVWGWGRGMTAGQMSSCETFLQHSTLDSLHCR